MLKTRAIILAAGEASRLGEPKALVTLRGESFLSRLARVFRLAGVDDVVVVVGGTHSQVTRHEARACGVRVRLNTDPREGPISSIRVGLAAEPSDCVDAYLLHPVDIPGVEAEDVRSLLMVLSDATLAFASAQPLVAGRRAHPVAIVAAERHRVLAAATLKEALHDLGERVAAVPCDNSWLRFDVDTPEDLAELRARFPY